MIKALFGGDAKILYEQDFQALLLANMFAPLGTALLSPILDSMIVPFGTSPANIGLLISGYTAPAIISIPIAGVLADRIGRKPILVVSLLLFGGGGAAIAFTTNLRVALGLRILQGAAFGGLTPIIVTSIGDIYEGAEEATGQGLRFTGAGLSNTVFPLLAGFLVLSAWQYPFFIYATAIPFAGLVHLQFTEPADFKSATATSTADVAPKSHIRALFRLVRHRHVLAIVISRGLPLLVWIGFLTYNSIVIVGLREGTPAQAGLLFAIGSLAMALTASQVGRITAIFDSRFVPLIAAHVCLGVGFSLFLLSPLLLLAGMGTALLGAGFGLASSLYRSLITGFATDSQRGSLVSLAESVGRVSATVTPIIMGGAIAVASPYIGKGPSVQVAGLTIAALASVGGLVCLLIAKTASRLPHEV